MRALAAVAALVFSGPALAEERIVKASEDPGLGMLASVFRVHELGDDRGHVAIRLFESGGGDPAMNGNRLLLAVVPGPDQRARVWETGIDVYAVRGVALDAGKSELSIDATEHVPGDDGAIRERSRRYTLRYGVDPESGAVSETIRVRTSP
jgi:hypothetical protein